MHETTRREDLLQKLLQALGKFNLSLDKLCGVATDGAPAIVGKHKGMVSLLKNEMDAKGIRHDRLVFFRGIVHQQAFVQNLSSLIMWYRWLQTVFNFIKKKTETTACLSKFSKTLTLITMIFFISVLFVGQVVGICLGAFILFCQKLLSLEI